MIWRNAAEFWAMGGYAVYVWGSLGVSAGLLALEVGLTRWGRQQALDAVCEAMQSDRDDEPDHPVHLPDAGTAAPTTFWVSEHSAGRLASPATRQQP